MVDQLRKSSFRCISHVFILLLLLLSPSTKIYKSIGSFFGIFGFSSKTLSYSINAIVLIVLFNIGYDFVIIVRELSNRMFVHEKDSSSATTTTTKVLPLKKPAPLYTSPLKDSYNHNSAVSKNGCGVFLYNNAGSASISTSNLSQSPLKLSSSSPKFSERERVNSPLSALPRSSDPFAAYLSPSSPAKGNYSWTAALDLHLNKEPGVVIRDSLDSFPKKEDYKTKASTSSLSGSGLGGNQPTSFSPNELVSKQSKLVVEREILNPETALQYCNMGSDWDIYIENIRNWFIGKILLPLSQQIREVDEVFESAGLSHLTSRFPATYSMAAKSLDGERRMRSHLFLSAPSASFNEPRIQSLLDLVHSRPNDPLVKLRLKIEKYLNIAAISSHRAALIKKINNLSQGSFINSFHSSSLFINTTSTSTSSNSNSNSSSSASASSSTAAHVTSGSSTSTEPFDDSQVLFHLFCTFMDENLPSENANDSQPFTSNYFVPIDEKPSSRPDAIQIQQISSIPPLTLQLIAETKVLQAHPSSNNVLEIILFMVDYVHRNRKGYLGIGNLDSKNIDLISVLRK